MAAEIACQHSGLSSHAIIAVSVRLPCSRDGANSTGRRVRSSDCSAMALSDSITAALAATIRSKAAARAAATSAYEPSASRQDAAGRAPGCSFAARIRMPFAAQACAKRSRASRASRSRSSAYQSVCAAAAALAP